MGEVVHSFIQQSRVPRTIEKLLRESHTINCVYAVTLSVLFSRNIYILLFSVQYGCKRTEYSHLVAAAYPHCVFTSANSLSRVQCAFSPAHIHTALKKSISVIQKNLFQCYKDFFVWYFSFLEWSFVGARGEKPRFNIAYKNVRKKVFFSIPKSSSHNSNRLSSQLLSVARGE